MAHEFFPSTAAWLLLSSIALVRTICVTRDQLSLGLADAIAPHLLKNKSREILHANNPLMSAIKHQNLLLLMCPFANPYIHQSIRMHPLAQLLIHTCMHPCLHVSSCQQFDKGPTFDMSELVSKFKAMMQSADAIRERENDARKDVAVCTVIHAITAR